MRSSKELMKDIIKKKAYYLAKKQMHRLIAASVALTAMLVLMIIVAPGVGGSSEQYTSYALGATILGPSAGGYVIVAILAFALGAVMVLLIQKHNRIKELDRLSGNGQNEDQKSVKEDSV